jgi:cysteine desulfurase
MRRVYMDHAATTPVDGAVLEEMKPYFSERFGNASSIYSFGREAAIAVDSARKRVARAIGAKPEEIVFNSGGTESDNTALTGVAFANRERGNHIITTKIEHHAVLETCRFLEKQGFEVSYLDVDSHGLVDLGSVEKAIKDETILVSVMCANNELGTIQPVREIGKICREKGVVFHTDAVQSLGKIPLDVEKLNVDLLSLSAHKIYGPKGVGTLYVRKGVRVEPLIHGGSHEFGKRAGTENVAGIVGFGKAAEIAVKRMAKDSGVLRELGKVLEKGVLGIPDSYLNGPKEIGKRLPGYANFRFDFIEGESIILRLDMEGIAGSTGSACSTKSLQPSHVLLALGLKHEQAHGSLRLSMGRSNDKEDVDRVLEVLPRVVSSLREISPLKAGV